jgi:hypothetical protein
MDLAQATGMPETVILGGEEYSVRLLSHREWGAVQAFLKRELPSPVTRVGVAIDEARAAGTPLSKAAVDQLYERAEAAATRWPPQHGSQAWINALSGIDGGDAEVLFEVLSKTDPAFTVEQAEALAPKVVTAEWDELFRVSLYGGPPRPKDGTAPSGTTT